MSDNPKPPAIQDKNRKPGTFTKGDPRINRHGRPKTSDELRTLAQMIAHETAKQGGQDFIIDGHKVTVTEAILRSWAVSKDPRLASLFMAYAFGKPPDETRITGAGGAPLITRIEIIKSVTDNDDAGDS